LRIPDISVRSSYHRAGLIAYSEATRFTPEKRIEAEAWCRSNHKRLGQHVLYPRTKGFIACVQRLRQAKHVRAVYDVTIAYAKNGRLFQVPPRFFETVLQSDLDKRWDFFVHVDRHPLDKLPTSGEELAQWLEDRWVEKGQRLERLRQLLEAGLPWDASSIP
jgi:hypothetical protein